MGYSLNFRKSLMVLVVVSMLGNTEVIFIRLSAKVTGAYYRGVLLSLEPSAYVCS